MFESVPAGSIPVSPVALAGPFESMGVSDFPWYANAVFPHAVYDSATNAVWMTWSGWSGTKRTVLLRVFDLTTGLWGPVITVDNGRTPLANDSHGNPAICRNADGFWYIFHGCHETNCLVEGMWEANDPTTWGPATTATGGYSYPHPSVVGGFIYLFLRDGTSLVNDQFLCLRKGTPDGAGGVSWAAQVNIADLGVNTRFYNGSNYVSGTNILIVGCRADAADTHRDNVYFLSYDTTTGNVSNIDGSHTTLAASLPVNATDLDAFYKIVDQSGITNLTFWSPSFCIDTNGNYHFLYCGPATANNQGIWYIGFVGGSLTAPVLLDGTNLTRAEMSISALSAGRVQAFWTHTGAVLDGPSDIWSAVWDGSWRPSFVLQTQARQWGLYAPTPIFNETPGAAGSVVFTEATPAEVDPGNTNGASDLNGFFNYQGRFYGASKSYTGIGDLLGTARGYWGLRALSYATRGTNCVKLRRDSDNATQIFATLSTGDLDLAAIVSFAGTAGLFVDTLYDQSGAGNDMAQATAASQPRFVLGAAGLNNRPAMQFSGTQSLSCTVGAVSQPWVNVAAAIRTGTFTAFGTIISGNSASRGLYFNNAANQIGLFAGGAGATASASDSVWHALAGTANGANSVLAVDGTAAAVSVGAGANGGVCAMGDDGAGDPLTGFIVEAGVFANYVNSTLATTLSANQRAYWGF